MSNAEPTVSKCSRQRQFVPVVAEAVLDPSRPAEAEAGLDPNPPVAALRADLAVGLQISLRLQ